MRKSRKRIPVFTILCFILLALALWAVGDGVYAKYVKNNSGTGYVRAKAFYFKSDLLSEEKPIYTLSSDTTQVEFTLMNYADTLRMSEDTIEYTVTVTGGGVIDTDASPAEKTGSLAGQSVNDVVITLTNLQPEGTYEVTARGSAGYEAEIAAVFKVDPNKENVYKYVSYTSSEVLLTVWTENVSGPVLLTFLGQGLIPDTTDANLEDINNYNKGTGKYDGFSEKAAGELGIFSSRTYRFFKDSAFSGGEFSVTVADKTAEDSIPK